MQTGFTLVLSFMAVTTAIKGMTTIVALKIALSGVPPELRAKTLKGLAPVLRDSGTRDPT